MPVLGEILHPQLGRVIVNTRANSRSVTARWRNGLVNLNIPAPLGLPDINRLLDDFTPRLILCRPTLRYTAPMTLAFPGVEFKIARQSFLPDKILATANPPICSLEVGTSLDLNDDAATRAVSSMLCRMARKIAPGIIMPRAHWLAASVRRHPVAWAISNGFHTLGSCSARGIISLSYILVFLPQDLRDYVICHELAHLSEMNHSQRFHHLLDTYLNGREADLVARLRTYTWPILRR